MKKYPERINKCPVEEVVLELRFHPKIPSGAVFGGLYSRIRDKYPNHEELPILQLPELVRDQDENLKYLPHYKCKRNDGKFSLQVGPRVIALVHVKPYVGWVNFQEEIKVIIEILKDADVVDEFIRFGLRYVDAVEYQIIDKLNLDISIIGKKIENEPTTFQTTLSNSDGSFNSRILIANNINYISSGIQKDGSIIDIDNYYIGEEKLCYDNLSALIDNAHDLHKDLFFSLLSDDYLASLDPIYKDN